MSTHAKLTGKHQYVEFKDETIQGRVKKMVAMREAITDADDLHVRISYGTIVVLVHHAWAPRDPYTEIQYPPFDELWKNDKFKKECMRNFFENSDDKFVAELARWLQYGSECRYPCPLLPVDLYFTADGLEKRWFNYQDDVPTAEDIIANLVFENSLA